MSSDGSQCSSPHSQQNSPHSSHHSPVAFTSGVHTLHEWVIQQHSPPMNHSHSPPMNHHQIPVSMPPTDVRFIDGTAQLGFSAIPTNYNPNMGFFPNPQAAMTAGIPMDQFPNMEEQISWLGGEAWTDVNNPLQLSPMPRIPSVGSGSPNSSCIDIASLPGSSHGLPGENWGMVDWRMMSTPQPAVFNPGQTLHLSGPHSDPGTMGGFSDINLPYSPTGSEYHDSGSPVSHHHACYHDHSSHMHMPVHHGHGHSHGHSHSMSHSHSSSQDLAAVITAPLPIKTSASSSSRSSNQSRSPGNGSGLISSSPSSAVVRSSAGVRKSPTSKVKVVRRSPTGKKDGTGEKKVGRRRGPLLPEQRKQASEIRKLRACLRCKFLKKTCDKGEPCAGCQPSHARLWQVPCTRIDIKDINYFMKDWTADYGQPAGNRVSMYDVKSFGENESLMWITHGYGFALPVMVREVAVMDRDRLEVDWVESNPPEPQPSSYTVRTELLDIGSAGISPQVITEYLEKHLDERFEEFVDEYFEGTPFITEILKTAHRYYKREQSPVIRKALKLVIAYNLTMHITMIEKPSPDEKYSGVIEEESSKFCGRTVAPVLINIQIKSSMAEMWRELQKDVLEELSTLYSSVYSGDRLKNWPTIFMLASILLAVWEEMQFDCHYRVPDPASVSKFCNDMETTPVGVIVGLFHAISQKLPALSEWDTAKHGHVLNNNPAVCDALTEVRQHVLKHEAYLRSRSEAKYNRNDFDCLSSKFLSKLVIKSH